MPDLSRIVEWKDAIDSYELGLYTEFVRRLETGIGNWLEYDECLALIYLLGRYYFVFEDGFDVDNAMSDIGHYAVVASCFCQDRKMTARVTKQEYRQVDYTNEFELLAGRLKLRLHRCPGLQLVSPEFHAN